MTHETLEETKGADLPNEGRNALEGEMVELGVRRVLADLAEDAHKVLKHGSVRGKERLTSSDDDPHRSYQGSSDQ